MKWTGRDIARLMQNSGYKWNSGNLETTDYDSATGHSHCAVGQLALALGAPAEHIEDIPVPIGLSDVFRPNDAASSMIGAASRIAEAFKGPLPVAKYEKNIRKYMKANGLGEPKPDCKLLEKVKRLHKESA